MGWLTGELICYKTKKKQIISNEYVLADTYTQDAPQQ